jgi:hypothetical protein
MVFKKCIGCKREFTKEELDKIQTQQKASKERPLKNTCPDCLKPLKTYDESRFQKKWYGYISNDKRMVEHLVLVEFHYYDDDSFEVKVPLLNLAFETKDFSEAINIPDKNISMYLRSIYEKVYSNEHKFLTQAYINETIFEKQDVTVWW